MKTTETKKENTITSTQVKKLLFRVYKRYQSGAISEAQAGREAQLLNYLLKATLINTEKEDLVWEVILPQPPSKRYEED
jgi:hypothetical protein